MSKGTPGADGKVDYKPLGRLFESRRLALGMRPGEFAVFAGLSSSVSRDGSSIRALEIFGKPHFRTIVLAAEALGIDDEAVRNACGLDLAKLRKEWEARAAEPVPVVVSIRAAPLWIQRTPPMGLDRGEILAWAVKELPKCLRCVHWSRIHVTYLRPDNSSYDIHARFGDNDVGPLMRFR
jgi:hypothetical protein